MVNDDAVAELPADRPRDRIGTVKSRTIQKRTTGRNGVDGVRFGSRVFLG